jgi:hypothetical protein
MRSVVPGPNETSLWLHAAGRSIGDIAYVVRGVPAWQVLGCSGENLIRAEGPTRDAAWRAAVGQAGAVGMSGARSMPAHLGQRMGRAVC